MSLSGMGAGAVVVLGLLGARGFRNWTAIFLVTTAATSATGFLFRSHFGAAHVVGGISLAALAVALFALYFYRLAGRWRWLYVAGSMLALYLNVFVGVVQAFQKLPFLRPLAPTGSEPPFVVAQVLVMAIFIALGIIAVMRFHPGVQAIR